MMRHTCALLLFAFAGGPAQACEPLVVKAFAGPASPGDIHQQALDRALLALAQVPGDGLSDLLLAKATCRPVGVVAAWPPRTLPASARADVDADAMAAILLHDAEYRGVPAAQQRALEKQLLAAAPANAYYAVSLLDPAADSGNRALRDAALRAGAAAPHYRSPLVPALASALDRFDAAGVDPTPAPVAGAEPPGRLDIAVALTLAVDVLPGVSGIVATCKAPRPEHRADCRRLAATMLAGSTTILEAAIAASILDAIDAGPGGEPSWRHRAPVDWLRSNALPIVDRLETLPEPWTRRYLAELRAHGELAALRVLLEMDGKPASPPAGWVP